MNRVWGVGSAFLLLLLAIGPIRAQDEGERRHRPVTAVADASIEVGAKGRLPLYLSADWTKPLPGVRRAVIVLHGRQRNADSYFRSALAARAAAGEAGASALMIAPQFLAEIDIRAHDLPDDTLRWSATGWEGGEPALGPSPASSFDALDAILARLADRKLFPNLAQVVVAGHSGGGQVAQRYAIAAKGDAALLKAGIAIRYVVANPSSYAYFGSERPVAAVAASCPRFDDWKYGMKARPLYLAAADAAELERAYVARRVIYLLGTRDIDPAHAALDKSCMAEAQGPHRYARGHAYTQIMQARDAGTPNHSVWDVRGVGHNGDRMLTSRCGLAALFDVGTCDGAR